MNSREIKIAKAILHALHACEGQMDEIGLHREVNDPQGTDLGASVSELRSVVALCDGAGWLTGVKNKISGRMKWNINDAGEAALLEL